MYTNKIKLLTNKHDAILFIYNIFYDLFSHAQNKMVLNSKNFLSQFILFNAEKCIFTFFASSFCSKTDNQSLKEIALVDCFWFWNEFFEVILISVCCHKSGILGKSFTLAGHFIQIQKDHTEDAGLLNPNQDGGGGKKPPPTSFTPVTSTNITIGPQNFLSFSFNVFATACVKCQGHI